MQTSIDAIYHDDQADMDDHVGAGPMMWIVAAVATELVVAIIAALTWMTGPR
jgi:hypothetical protein